MVERFTKVRANTLSIYYTMSTWNRIGGFAGNVTISPPATTPKGIVPLIDTITTSDNSVTFKIKVKGSARPGNYPLVFAGKDDTGRERDATLTLVVQ